jgi:hypothetical protein
MRMNRSFHRGSDQYLGEIYFSYKIFLICRKLQKNPYETPHFLGSNLEMTYEEIRDATVLNSPIAIRFAPEVFATITIEVCLPK